MTPWLEFFVQLAATLIGAGVGFFLAMWWDRLKQKQEDQRREIRTIRSILSELARIEPALDVQSLQAAKASSGEGAVDVELQIPFFPAFAFLASVHSGNLALLAPELQSDLSVFHEQLRIARTIADNIATTHARGLEVDEELTLLSNSYEHLAGHAEMLRSELKSLREELLTAERSPRLRKAAVSSL